MKVEINNFEIGTQKDIFLVPPLQGLATPSIRTSTGNYSGRDGGWLSSQFFSPRQIVVSGVIHGGTCEEAEAIRCRMLNALQIRQSLPFTYTTPTGDVYYTDVYFIDLLMDIVSTNTAPFKITLLAPDPYLYKINQDNPDSGWQEQTIFKTLSGGYVTPYVLPIAWAGSRQNTLITNPTTNLIFPQIILEGKFTNPIITNTTTGQYIQVNVTTSLTDTIVIDMKERTILLNGGSILPYREGTWWPIIAGTNSIEMNSDGETDTTEGIIRYRTPYTGVFEGTC